MLCVVSWLSSVVCRMGFMSCCLMLIVDVMLYDWLVLIVCFVFHHRVFHVVVDRVVCCLLRFVR